jgi:PAS domain S-box-containing protein
MKSFFKSSKNINENNSHNLDNQVWIQEFIDYSPSPILRADIDGNLLYTNQAFSKMLDYLSKVDLQKMSLKNELFPDIDKWDLFISTLQKNDRLENHQIDLLKKNGEIISVRIDLRNIKDENGKTKYFEGIVVEKKKDDNYEELLAELEALKEKEKKAVSNVTKANYTKNVKSQYLANMTHEIKTPINSIVGFLTLIEQKLFDSEEELQDFAHNARTSADSLLEIMNNILDISRLEADKMELDECEFDLSKEVEKAKTIASPASGEKNLTINTNISNKIEPLVVGDPLRYRQVLVNVLANSFKYTESGSIDISVEIEKERELSYLIKTTVKDTGIGIPKEKLSLLFKPYTQVKAKKWNKQDGSGLGLMICKELVRLMDGEIVIKSKEGVGTIVEFTTTMKLPKALEKYDVKEKTIEPEKQPKEQIVEEPTRQKTNGEDTLSKIAIKEEQKFETKADDSKIIAGEVIKSSDFTDEPNSDIKRILLVEDNPISQKVELKLLKESGYNVEAVSNGFDAIEAVKTNGFNLVLMDVEMAEMNGLESTKRIRALEAPTGKIPIIAVTAHSSMKDREKCLASGMNDYIAKPININFMKMTIDHWLLKEIEI